MITCAGPALAADRDGLSVHGSVRVRVETIDGQARAGTLPAETLVNTKTIVQARYRHGALTLGTDVIDSRVIAPVERTAASTSEVNALEPVQLFAQIDVGKGPGPQARLILGRQTADIASRRLIVNDEYRNTATGFTGVRLDASQVAGWSGSAFYFLPQQRLPEDLHGIRGGRVRFDREGFDTRLWGAVVGRSPSKRVALDFGAYRFEERDRPDRATRDRQLTTLTARLLAPPAPGRWDAEIEAMRQTGSIAASLAPTAARLPVEAWFGHAELGYQWARPWQPHVVVEADYATGDKRDGHYRRFDTLYGGRRADFAPAGLYNAISRSNLLAVGPRVELTPSKRLDGYVTVKQLWLASAVDAFATTGVVDPTGQSGRDGGVQTEGRLRFIAIPKRLLFEAYGDWIVKGRFLRAAPNRASNSDTVYASLNATVTF